MPNKRPTQVTRIAKYIEDFGSITHLEAMRDIGVMRLASRITELRQLGYPIVTEMISVENRYGEKCRIARYRMESESANSHETA